MARREQARRGLDRLDAVVLLIRLPAAPHPCCESCDGHRAAQCPRRQVIPLPAVTHAKVCCQAAATALCQVPTQCLNISADCRQAGTAPGHIQRLFYAWCERLPVGVDPTSDRVGYSLRLSKNYSEVFL